jgi:hypothetical protein
MAKNQLRSSQIITTFGPGAMVDLPDASVIIAGLDQWRYDQSKIPQIEEPRLVNKLRAILGINTLTLRTPPPASDQDYGFRPDITAWRFQSGSSSKKQKQLREIIRSDGWFISIALTEISIATKTPKSIPLFLFDSCVPVEKDMSAISTGRFFFTDQTPPAHAIFGSKSVGLPVI